jgi:hypothetical protein
VTTPSEFRLSLVDSSGWIEYLTDGRKADLFAPFLELEEFLLVPSIVFYEVYKKLLAVSEANPAIRTAPWRFVSHALRATNAVFDADIALKAVECHHFFHRAVSQRQLDYLRLAFYGSAWRHAVLACTYLLRRIDALGSWHVNPFTRS